MSVLLDRKAFEAALPDMAVAAIVPMVAAHMTGEPPVHERAEGVRGRGLKHKMEVVGHEAEAEELDGIAGFGVSEQVEEGSIVAVLVKDSCAAIATVEDVVDMAGDLTAWDARHHL